MSSTWPPSPSSNMERLGVANLFFTSIASCSINYNMHNQEVSSFASWLLVPPANKTMIRKEEYHTNMKYYSLGPITEYPFLQCTYIRVRVEGGSFMSFRFSILKYDCLLLTFKSIVIYSCDRSVDPKKFL